MDEQRQTPETDGAGEAAPMHEANNADAPLEAPEQPEPEASALKPQAASAAERVGAVARKSVEAASDAATRSGIVSAKTRESIEAAARKTERLAEPAVRAAEDTAGQVKRVARKSQKVAARAAEAVKAAVERRLEK